ncbi:hypothetical protein C1X35_10470 [Pseudomonas sp. FW306-1C-G01A]|nr:hypothetical protein C1X56_15040 [Pseudomonas sp. GW101-1A09]PMV95637.1 hypothetical protein C1X55_21275 [Pseudomonas sp. GW460-C8]PMV97627.1 hypothetical protein C1X51_04530 [Pseudomonas sp. FW306-2-2C-B10A]PMW04979.1 hypothetical protein C1X50_15340 [Pseudomonas sp. MPR-TSA4]PMW13147.1 hypothetical protein C1X52_17910 [Pseudomonas sp. FW306-2-1A-C05A]PMW18231.1 hypothetical protein C1X40_15405 [Pseudomonas sp. GW456-11-11-14-TSB2]PMW18961.1 hypothetical protein C1X53_20455 [Pseudomonas s
MSQIHPDFIEGEIIRDALVSPTDMARMNEARAAFNELRSILLAQVVPVLGGWSNPLATEIESRLESITFASRNFLWPNRHAGAAHDALIVRGAQ